ncbi:hypothetical protein CHRY9293_01093 [Chryseobacterium potabilaquae]|uniref:Uncharacterized protein n=1 Tax=Chryseobacterium potabilaquae TaxID=2675057 RepID=A0A6N4X5M8_9FLAO|nr:hypothetical protein CHRY9293_01093 [Chryseobacterium potabilaquae]
MKNLYLQSNTKHQNMHEEVKKNNHENPTVLSQKSMIDSKRKKQLRKKHSFRQWIISLLKKEDVI